MMSPATRHVASPKKLSVLVKTYLPALTLPCPLIHPSPSLTSCIAAVVTPGPGGSHTERGYHVLNWTRSPLPHSEMDRWRVPRMGRIQGMTHRRCGEDTSALTCLYVHVTRWEFWATLLKALCVCAVCQTDQNANRSSWGAMYRHKNKTRRRLFFHILSLIAEGWESRCFQLLGSHKFKKRTAEFLLC